jgi:hypothetical protein
MQEVERMHENKKTTLNGINNVKCHWLPHIILILNGHMHLSGEYVVFGLTHTCWWVNMFICHLDIV